MMFRSCLSISGERPAPPLFLGVDCIVAPVAGGSPTPDRPRIRPCPPHPWTPPRPHRLAVLSSAPPSAHGDGESLAPLRRLRRLAVPPFLHSPPMAIRPHRRAPSIDSSLTVHHPAHEIRKHYCLDASRVYREKNKGAECEEN